MTRAILLLLGVGIAAQALLMNETWRDLMSMTDGYVSRLSADEIALYFSPLILSLVGAGTAWWAQRRGSKWAAWLVGLPLGIFAAGFLLVLWLTFFPPTLGHH